MASGQLHCPKCGTLMSDHARMAYQLQCPYKGRGEILEPIKPGEQLGGEREKPDWDSWNQGWY